MQEERIKSFFSFMQEREEIRLRKEAGSPHPWTDDPILNEYKFTNVKRSNDRTSAQLIQEFYVPHYHQDPKDILLNCGLARYFGTIEFMRAIGWRKYDDPGWEDIKEIAKRRLEQGQRVFTGAYVITNQGISAPKQDVVIDVFMKGLHAAIPYLVERAKLTNSWEDLAIHMSCINGFGGTGFMTKEVLLDTMYAGFWEGGVPGDYDFWTPIGPGARRGLARLCGHDEPKKAPKKKDTEMMSDIMKLVEYQWKVEYKKYGVLHPTDIQFQLCEFDKYERVRLGQGRPRSKYRP